MIDKIVIALGGNAILQKGDEGTADRQYERVHEAIRKLKPLIEKVPNVVITHGNGPQVGDILLRYELTKNNHPMMPLDVCNAQSQGFIGYMILDAISDIMKNNARVPAALVTRVRVEENDTAFQNPTKPVGPWYEKDEVSKLEEMGFVIKKIKDNSYRRVVPSPKPVEILELESVKRCLEQSMIVIASGGGGIPVIKDENGKIKGVEAVIDKDFAGCLLAKNIGADMFIILTDVDRAYLNYGKKNEKELSDVSVTELKKYESEKHFADGSMGPKVNACIDFVESTGNKAIITSLNKAAYILDGEGTHIHS